MYYKMKDVCKMTNLTYDTLKYYCNIGLIPNVKRDKNNYRIFTTENIKWIETLNCLKKCNMNIVEIKEYIDLCLQGNKTINKRKEILNNKQIELNNKIIEIQKSIDFIKWKQNYYDELQKNNTNNN